MNAPQPASHPDLAVAARLRSHVIDPLRAAFIGKDAIAEALGVCLVAGEHCFLHGPPGTAKSALVHELGRLLQASTFDYLLTRFTEPNELFGPFDIRRLREGELVTNTEGMLPEADLVFLDELLNANSALLNSLLMALNERVFRRGRESRPLPALLVVGASNSLPEDEALRALFDRFLLRLRCEGVDEDRLPAVLDAGWRLEEPRPRPADAVQADEIRRLRRLLPAVDLAPSRATYLDLVRRLRAAGLPVSDRRAVRLQRLVAASALLSGRLATEPSDCWVLRHTWDAEDQVELVAGIVQRALADAGATAAAHPQAGAGAAPAPERLAAELAAIEAAPRGDQAATARLRDRLAALAGRCQWVADDDARADLERRVEALWRLLGTSR